MLVRRWWLRGDDCMLNILLLFEGIASRDDGRLSILLRLRQLEGLLWILGLEL
jgi:hypothetical protein